MASIGLDIGGTKIAGAAFNDKGAQTETLTLPTPATYGELLENCRNIVERLEKQAGKSLLIGVCSPYADDSLSANVPALVGRNLRRDLEKLFNRPVPFGNDANCAALAEAMDGAGQGHRAVFGLIMGTGIGGGFVLDGQVWAGRNGQAGEIGHLPLPYYEVSDGELVACGCGQKGCIEKLIAGPALARFYRSIVGKATDARKIAEDAQNGDDDALRVLDSYYEIVAKAMVTILHSFDPDIIVVSGGLNALPGLYDEVPKRWGRYAVNKKTSTQFVPAQHGSMAGLRGAAWLGRQ